jgi:hypothetical protein
VYARALDVAVSPLDVVRRRALQLATRSTVFTRVLGRRDSRLALLATFQLAALFGLAVRAPVALFFLGPVLFGVAHLAADVRYLALHRAPPRALLVASVGLAIAITLVRVGVGTHVLRTARGDQADVALGLAWVGVAIALGLRDRPRLRLPILVPLTLLAPVLVMNARAVGLVLVHGHNLVAVAAWLLLFRRRWMAVAVPLTLLVALTAVLFSGAYLPWTFAHGGLAAFGSQADSLRTWIAPGLAPQLGVAAVVTFVFLQGVHYAAWTGWIPQDDLVGEGTPTFRMSLRSLVKDFGPVGFGVIALLAIGFIALSAWDIRLSLRWYMTLARSHAWFELAFLSYFMLRGALPRRELSRGQ